MKEHLHLSHDRNQTTLLLIASLNSVITSGGTKESYHNNVIQSPGLITLSCGLIVLFNEWNAHILNIKNWVYFSRDNCWRIAISTGISATQRCKGTLWKTNSHIHCDFSTQKSMFLPNNFYNTNNKPRIAVPRRGLNKRTEPRALWT